MKGKNKTVELFVYVCERGREGQSEGGREKGEPESEVRKRKGGTMKSEEEGRRWRENVVL